MSFICLGCIGDESLREIVEDGASKVECTYCGQTSLGVPMDKLAEVVDEPLREYCRQGAESPYHEQQGDPLAYLLQEELEIDREPAEELAEILEENDPADPRDGDEPFFSSEQNYQRAYLHSGEYAYSWAEFSNRIKHARRFFDDGTRERLADILGALGSQKADELPVLEVGPGTKVESLYRARRAESDAKGLAILKDPARELGPPQPELAVAGRMNPAGISVFYGALSEDTAIAEVRPFVGSLVIVGRFTCVETLRLLDLTQIGIGFTGSIFRPGYEDRATRLRFLEGFHTLIARPIQPREEHIEHIPTQAVAEYVSNVLGFDGILYASAQVGAVPDVPEPTPYVTLRELSEEDLGRHNVALFGAAARVRQPASDEEPSTDPDPIDPWLGQPFEPGIDFPEPAQLSCVDDSARAVRVTAVRYSHEWAQVYDPDWKPPGAKPDDLASSDLEL